MLAKISCCYPDASFCVVLLCGDIGWDFGTALSHFIGLVYSSSGSTPSFDLIIVVARLSALDEIVRLICYTHPEVGIPYFWGSNNSNLNM